jgi:hypothetical protein
VLTEDERRLVQQAFMRGPSALLERGFSHEDAAEFMRREDVQEQVALLDRELAHQESIAARTRFGVRRDLSKLASGAASILGAAMAGPAYARDADGNILRDAKGRPVIREAGPSSLQVSAAGEVLDRIGVGRDAKDNEAGRDMKLNILFGDSGGKVAIEITNDPNHKSEEEKALSRERIRTVISKVTARLPQLRERVAEVIEPKKAKKKSKRKKKKQTNKKAK